MEDKASIIFNISGGNNQIAPNATTQQQIFYGDLLNPYVHLLKKHNFREIAKSKHLYVSKKAYFCSRFIQFT